MKRWLQRARTWFWPLLGLVAVVWSLDLLYTKLAREVASDPAIRKLLEEGGFWSDLKVIVVSIANRLREIPPSGYVFAFASTLVAYAALAWYDRIALTHLRKEMGISWGYIAVTSFVTYALGHNIGASVLSGGMVRLRAYTAKGLSAAEVAVLILLCTYTFVYGTLILLGLVFLFEPQIVVPLGDLILLLALPEPVVRGIGLVLLAVCALYVVGSWLHLPSRRIGKFELMYPRLPVVGRQVIAAPLELLGAAGIIYFALPEQGNPGYFIVLGAFLLSFSAGLLSQVPGGVGVMEAVFLAVMPTIAPTAVVAALLVWRLLYLLLPLGLSVPVILCFERRQLARATSASGDGRESSGAG
ncbi:MAG: YbhN family protein [Casimicrobiaceae bacterium]